MDDNGFRIERSAVIAVFKCYGIYITTHPLFGVEYILIQLSPMISSDGPPYFLNQHEYISMNITPDLPFLNIYNPFTNERICYTWTNIVACL